MQTQGLTSYVYSNEIKNKQYFDPISYVNYIEKKDLMFYNDSLSAIAYYKVYSVLNAQSSKYRLSGKFITKNDKEQERRDFRF